MEWEALHNVLQNLMNEMLPLGQRLTGVGRGLGGIGAMLYVGSRIWRQLANNEPIDFYPLFRPFVIAFFLTIYPSFINGVNGILQPTVMPKPSKYAFVTSPTLHRHENGARVHPFPISDSPLSSLPRTSSSVISNVNFYHVLRDHTDCPSSGRSLHSSLFLLSSEADCKAGPWLRLSL